jgi:hypothetical protein
MGFLNQIFVSDTPGKTYRRGRLSTVDLLVLTCLDQLLLLIKILYTFLTEQATLMRRTTVLSLPPSVGIPCIYLYSYSFAETWMSFKPDFSQRINI